MRAAILRSYGSIPEIGDWPEPAGASVEVVAAGLNPVDLRIASGTFYAGSPDPPYVPGSEGVARADGGGLFYFRGAGAFAERAVAVETVAVPEGVPAGLALACGTPGCTALLALERARLGEGERVLVLGASGSVGRLAVALAPLLGAGEVVGAARSGGEWLPLDAVAEAGPFDVVIDPLWGEAAEAAARALAAGGRLVALGESAGPQATFPSPLVRGRQLEILGLALPMVGAEARRDAYARVVALAAAGGLDVPFEEVPLDDVALAWERQASGSPGAKLVLVP